jgi:hypothetical protein
LPQKNKDSSVKTSKLSPNKFDRKLKQISAESKSRQNDAEIDDYVVINDGTFLDDDDYVDLNGQNVLEIEN